MFGWLWGKKEEAPLPPEPPGLPSGRPARVPDPRSKPHRCNDRIEDAIYALFEGSPSENFLPAAGVVWRCFMSEEGQEPTDPFRFYFPPGYETDGGQAAKKSSGAS